jgi:soluble lytic murein transglycosylase-like protein
LVRNIDERAGRAKSDRWLQKLVASGLLVGAPALLANPARSGPAPAQAGRSAPPPPAVLNEELPAVRRLLQQASERELAAETADSAWQAAVLYCEAARSGSLEGQYRLGMLYAFGQGVPESRSLAAALFSRAASQGHAQAGEMLESIELTSAELPACVIHGHLPEKAPPRLDAAAGGSPLIDAHLLSLAPDKRWIVPLTTTLSTWYSLDPKLVLSVIAVESNFDTRAQSPKAAAGLMQLIPGTAERFNVRNAHDATQNLRGGMRYLRWLLSYYRGNVVYALAAYNAGEKRVDRFRGVPPYPETRAYVQRVLRMYGSVRHAFDASLTVASPSVALER